LYLNGLRVAFFARVRAGDLVSEAASAVGVPATVGSSWLRQCGGVLPSSSQGEVGYRRLSIREREEILAGMERGESIRAISRSIGRAPSTVKREIDHNLVHQRYLGQRRLSAAGAKRTRSWRYSPHHAQLRAERKASRRTPAKLAVNVELRTEVQNRLEEEHSPVQIARRLRDEFPDRPEMWVSHETIYQSLYVQGRGALRRDLHKRLRTGRALRHPRRKDGERRSRIPDMVSISERPPEVEDRAVPGHWEGDLIMGSVASNSAIGTLVERTTRYVMLLHLPGGHGADAVADAMIEAMSRLPETLRQTLTWDQGIEMANHARIAAATDLDIYFCDPHSPWQRGSNENTNGLLRQYFPKSTDLSIYQPDYLDHVARKLNTRPRKTLDWRTPAEKLDQLLSNPLDPHGVALAG
jgi:IS30 family transposase